MIDESPSVYEYNVDYPKWRHLFYKYLSEDCDEIESLRDELDEVFGEWIGTVMEINDGEAPSNFQIKQYAEKVGDELRDQDFYENDSDGL